MILVKRVMYKLIQIRLMIINAVFFGLCRLAALISHLGFGFCSFDEIQRRGMDNLKQALLRTINKAQSTEGFPPSRIKQISVSSVVNKRRRQEDRWFFEPDLVAYAPIDRVGSSVFLLKHRISLLFFWKGFSILGCVTSLFQNNFFNRSLFHLLHQFIGPHFRIHHHLKVSKAI